MTASRSYWDYGIINACSRNLGISHEPPLRCPSKHELLLHAKSVSICVLPRWNAPVTEFLYRTSHAFSLFQMTYVSLIADTPEKSVIINKKLSFRKTHKRSTSHHITKTDPDFVFDATKPAPEPPTNNLVSNFSHNFMGVKVTVGCSQVVLGVVLSSSV